MVTTVLKREESTLREEMKGGIKKRKDEIKTQLLLSNRLRLNSQKA
jgi:hypothetical protein